MNIDIKNKRLLISKLIINIIFLIFYFFISLNYLLPYYNDLSKNKEELIEKDNLRNKLLSEGLSYSDFKSNLSKVSDKSDYEFKILSKIDKDFYNQNINNGTIDSFEDFFAEKEKQILKKENSKEIKNRSNKIDKILPFYVDGIDLGENNITDFEFINYVEKLLETFSLSTSNQIGIDRVEKVIDGSEANNTIDSSLFFIPLTLNLEGSKKNVIDFLYYLENIGNIEIIDNELKIYSDKNFHKIFLGDTYNPEYNVFEKQIISVEGIKFQQYLDSSIKNRGKLDFINFVKSEQSREKISFTIDLKFYVRGLSSLKVKAKINAVIQEYNTLVGVLNKKMLMVSKKNFLRKGSKAISIRNNIRSFVTTMDAKKNFFKKEIKKKRQDKNNLYELYKEMLEYEKGFLSIEHNLEIIDEKIKKLNK